MMAPEKAAEILDEARAHVADPARSAALVNVADGWTRLHEVVSRAERAVQGALEQTANIPLSFDPEDAALKAAYAVGPPARVIADPRMVIHETRINGIEAVVVPAKAKGLLVALGWTPPADPLAEVTP